MVLVPELADTVLSNDAWPWMLVTVGGFIATAAATAAVSVLNLPTWADCVVRLTVFAAGLIGSMALMQVSLTEGSGPRNATLDRVVVQIESAYAIDIIEPDTVPLQSGQSSTVPIKRDGTTTECDILAGAKTYTITCPTDVGVETLQPVGRN